MTTTAATTTATTQVYRVYIKASPEKIWDAITKREWTEKYGYGGWYDYDLRAGAPYKAYASAEMRAGGAPEVAIDGEVVEADPPRRLVLTWRMLMDEAMIAQGFTRLTWEIEPTAGGVTKLTVIHELDGAPMLQLLMSGGLEQQGAGGGWSWILSDLKSLIETGKRLSDLP